MASKKTQFEDSDDEPEQAPLRRQQHRDGDGSGDEPSTSGRSSGSDSDKDNKGEQLLEDKLANIPLEVLERLRTDGRGPVGAAARAAAAAAKQHTFKRENKHRPQEMTSKRPVGRFREVIQIPKNAGRDPRFDEVLHTDKPGDKDAAARRYSFLYKEVLPQEKAALKQRLKKEKSEARRAELQSQLTRLDQQLQRESMRRKKADLEQTWKRQEKASVVAGKQPYFMKKSEKRKLELVAKYEELKAAGRLDKYMEKRRKKNASKDHRYLPYSRRAGEEGME